MELALFAARSVVALKVAAAEVSARSPGAAFFDDHDFFAARAGARSACRSANLGLFVGARAACGVALKRKADSAPVHVQVQNRKLVNVANLYHFHRVFYKVVAKLAYVNQAGLVQSDVNKGAEVNDVADFSCHFHAGLEVFKSDDALLHDRSRIVRARVAVGLLQFVNDVVKGCFADRIFFFQLLFKVGGNFFLVLDKRKDFARERIVFGVNPSVVQGVGAFGDFQKARALLKGFWPQAGNFLQVLAACNLSVGVAIGHDLFCRSACNAGNVF